MKEIVICTYEKNKIMALIENGNILEIYNDELNENRIEGNIYLGKVQNVLQGMQAAFVDIGEKRNTFVHIKDLLPKNDIKKETENQSITCDIKDVVKQGDSVLVQVKRERTNKKGAKVSTHISIASRFSVFMPNVDFITISQKIDNEKEKNRLLNLFQKNLPKGSGAIIRTSAKGKTNEQIILDINKSIQKWENIQKQASEQEKSPRLIYENYKLLDKFFVDILDQDIDKIIVDDIEMYTQVQKIANEFGSKCEIILEKEGTSPKLNEVKERMDKIKGKKNLVKMWRIYNYRQNRSFNSN